MGYICEIIESQQTNIIPKNDSSSFKYQVALIHITVC